MKYVVQLQGVVNETMQPFGFQVVVNAESEDDALADAQKLIPIFQLNIRQMAVNEY